MSEGFDEFDRDHIRDSLRDELVDLYDDLGSHWSRTVPDMFQSDGYQPNRLTVGLGYNNEPNIRIPIYKNTDSDSHFIGIIAETDNDNVKIKVFLTVIENNEGVVDMLEDSEYNNPEKKIMNSFTVDGHNKEFDDLVNETVSIIKDIADEYEDKNIKSLILESA